MRIRLAIAVFTDGQTLADLFRIYQCLASGRHHWTATPDELVAADGYLAKHAPHWRGTFTELGLKGTVSAAWTARDRVWALHIGPHDLAEHADDLSRPAVLVVENEHSDGSFVRTVAAVLGSERLNEALRRGWLEIEHGGGETVPMVAQSKAKVFRRVPRVAALMDSDRMIPGQRTDKHKKAERLREAGIVTHVLELREAENYVPTRILRAVSRRPADFQRVGLFLRMTPAQRGYFDMKKGFGPPNGPPRISARQRSLYAGLDPAVLLGLRGGFGDNLLAGMSYHGGQLTQHDFEQLGDDVLDDLCSLLTKITDII